MAGRLIADARPVQLVVTGAASRPHDDRCWCRPPDVALAAIRRAERKT